MALRFLDSMGDHYTAAQATTKWTTALFATRDTGLHGYGMRGNLYKGMLFGSTVVMEAYIRKIAPGGGSLFRLADNGQNVVGNPVLQIDCAYDTAGAIRVERWGGSAEESFIAQTSPDLIREHIWYHFGWKVLVHPTAGSVDVRLNGEPIITVAGISTITALGPTYWSGVIGGFGVGDNGNGTIFDDFVVMDDVADGLDDPRLPGGGGFTKFLGPVEIIVKRPNGPGLAAEWTPSPAGANWDQVNDVDADDDATHNSAAPDAVGASDLHAMENLLPAEDVLAVQSLVCARKTEEGVAAAALLVHEGGATTVGPTVYQPNVYAYLHRAEPTLPDGSLWTKARWDAIQYGYRRIV